MHGRWVLGGLAMAAMAATCGGDGSSFSSGIDKGTELGALSPGDAQKLCDELNGWVKANLASDVKELSCRTAGLAASAFAGAAQKQTACSTAYDQCQKQPAENNATNSCDKPAASCKATVAELEACVNEIGPLMKMFVGSFPTCAQLASGSTTVPSSGNLQTPASCKTLQSKCADLDLPTTFPGGD